MEVGNKGVQDFKLIARIDENIRPAAAGFQASVFIGSGLHGTATGGSNADYPASGLLCVVYLLRLGLLHHVKFRVHMVVLDIFHLYRAESPQPHMEGHMGDFHSHILNLL